MQCKDIPDRPVLEFLRDLPNWPNSSLKMVGTWYGDEYRPENSVLHAMPFGVPEKLALAKVRMLMRRGLVDGCDCGRRGDFEIAPKGILSPSCTLCTVANRATSLGSHALDARFVWDENQEIPTRF